MRKLVMVICFTLAVGGGTATASGESSSKKPKPAWTESKAQRVVPRGATVRLAAEDRAALEAEFRPLAAMYYLLAMDAPLTGSSQEADAYAQLAYTYSRILAKVQRGLAIDAADCTGWGVATAGRFSSFRCTVTSESLELPPAQMPEDGEPPTEEQLRSLGPIDAVLEVRVTGQGTFAYKAL